MREKLTKEKEIKNMDNQSIIVEVVKSGNRFNAFDSDGNKYTSEITTGVRKKAFNNGMDSWTVGSIKW